MSYDVKKHAQVIVNYSLEIKKGDWILINAQAICEPLVMAIKKEAVIIGAQVTSLIGFEGDSEQYFENASDEFLGEASKLMDLLVDKIDAFISIGGSYNVKELEDIEPEKIALSASSEQKMNEVFFKRMNEGTLKVVITEFPTSAKAQEGNMSLKAYNKFVGDAMLLGEEDCISAWNKIHDEQQIFCDYLNEVEQLHIVSDDTDLTMSVKGRKWVNCDGRINFPDGEVFTGPVEDSVNGKIRFSYPGMYMGKAIEDIRLEFKDGKVISAIAKEGDEILQTILEVDEGVRFVGEIAVATNYGITEFTRNMLFDEKIGGTVHLALGNSLPGTGGENESVIHWDLLCDMHEKGAIYADNKLIYEKGKWLIG